MKTSKIYFIILSSLLCTSTFAQVQIDHEVQLTGTGTDARINGIKSVIDSLDAASVKSIQQGRLIYAVATGSSNNFSINITPPVSAYQAGMVFNFISNQTVTGPATLNVNSLGVISITKYVNQYLSGCEIYTGQAVTVLYDGTNFQMTSVIHPAALAGAPVAIAGSGAGPTQITANWDSAANATGYYLDAATDSEFLNPVANFTNLYVGDVFTYNITGLSCGTTYYYRVRAADNCGQSSNSNVISYSTPPYAGIPVATAGSGAMQTQITANWNSATNATGYYLDVATNSGFVNLVPGYNNLNVGNVTTYNVTGLSCGTTYYYRVRSSNNCTTSSSNSNTDSLSTSACCTDGAGGTIAHYTDSNEVEWTVHTFTSSSTFTPDCSGNIEVLVVAGGGGGGAANCCGGGGGAGGVIFNASYTVTAPQTYNVTVGNGGSGGYSGNGGAGGNGGNSVFGTLTAYGGGGGGTYSQLPHSGGSGGGSGGGENSYNQGASGTAGQGNAGGNGVAAGNYGGGGGGGGGAGGAGANATTGYNTYYGGNGGVGLAFSISGSSVYYGGGGGGGGANGGGSGGNGGGGVGYGAGTSGAANTGGGGGASVGNSNYGSAGGSGIVIISYPTP